MTASRPPVVRPAKPVRWLSPSVLLRTGLQAGLSSVFEKFDDKREQQAGIDAPVVTELAARNELWIDYVADVGDGFDATATVAHLLAAPSLDLAGTPAPRGSLLVMGGDEVYPFATTDSYEQRTIEPYRAMFPHSEPPHPLLLAVPGNHDWYDGLTSFMRVFTQRRRGDDAHGRWIGGWRTAQRRSYFAVRLPHRWWLWGIDIQLDTYIDGPQLEYFADVGRSVVAGDAIVLCSARPGWLTAGPDNPEAYSVLDFVERELIRPTGANLRLSITGDHHSYARYEHVPTGEQKIMSGGGSAYLADTHQLQPELELPPAASTDRGKSPARTFTLGATGSGGDARYPSAAASRAEARRFHRVLWRNGAGFPLLMGGAYALAGASAVGPGPWLAVTALYVLALAALTKELKRRRLTALAAGGAHAAAHLAIVAAIVTAAEDWSWWWGPLAAFGVGLVVGPLVFGLYLFLADAVARVNTNELFAGQGVDRFRSFLRLHLRSDGDLVVYAVGVDDSCRVWRETGADPGDGTPLLEPGDPVDHRLIDGPIRIRRSPVVATAEVHQ